MKKILCLVTSLALIVCTPMIAFGEEKADAQINAKAYVLMCMDTGDVLCGQNEYDHLSPASVTKVMSILLILEALDGGKINLTDKVTATKNAVSMGGTQIRLKEGESMTVDELLKAVVVASANDACTALGEHIAGSSVAFVKMMNDRAREMGLKNTNFENCTGLDDSTKNHYSCAYDLAVISSEVMKHTTVTKYSTIWLDSLRGGKTELNNTNKLVNRYQGITGLKTGTTSNAGFCVSATASRENLNLVAVVLGSDTSEHRFEAASNLLDLGFANYQAVKPKINNKKLIPVKVKNGKERYMHPVCTAKDVIVTEKGSEDLKYKYILKESVVAPVKKGDNLGKIKIVCGKKVVKVIPVVADKTVEKATFMYTFLHLLRNV